MWYCKLGPVKYLGVFRAVVHKLRLKLESPGRFVKVQVAGPHPKGSDFSRYLKWPENVPC